MTATVHVRAPGWRCTCTPIIARRTTERFSTVVVLHGPDCPLPVERRHTVTYRYRRPTTEVGR